MWLLCGASGSLPPPSSAHTHPSQPHRHKPLCCLLTACLPVTRSQAPSPASGYHTPRLQRSSGESAAGPLPGRMFPFPAPTPAAQTPARPPPNPPPPLATLSQPLLWSSLSSALCLMGSKVRGPSQWVWATQALGVGSLNLAQPTESFRTASRIPDPGSRLPSLCQVFSHHILGADFPESPAPDVPRTGPCFLARLPNLPLLYPTLLFFKKKSQNRWDSGCPPPRPWKPPAGLAAQRRSIRGHQVPSLLPCGHPLQTLPWGLRSEEHSF